MPHERLLTYSALLGAFALLVGCVDAPPFEEQVRELAKLPGATSSPNAELRERIAVLRQQRGAPDQMEPSGFTASARDNAAAQLAEIFSDMFRKQFAPRLEELVDTEQVAPKLLQTHAPALRKLEAAGSLSTCRFATDPESGYFAAMRYLDDVALAARFELLQSRQAAAEEDGAVAMSAWRRGMQWCHWLAKTPSVSSRVLAATLRAELLNELAMQLNKRVYGRYEAEQVYGLLRDHLSDWPRDRRMLLGDRAMVAHAYEALRKGHFDKMVTLDERERLKMAGVYDQLMQPDPAELDQDEANYLAAMELLLKEADTPYHQRSDTVWQATDLTKQLPNLAAYEMFFQGVTDAQLLAARDRTRCEAWSLALAAAADLIPPPFRTNPVNGLDYDAVIDQSRVTIQTHDDSTGMAICPRLSTNDVLSR